MIEVSVTVGLSGQIVIPKILRKKYGIMPNNKIIFSNNLDGIVMRKSKLKI